MQINAMLNAVVENIYNLYNQLNILKKVEGPLGSVIGV